MKSTSNIANRKHKPAGAQIPALDAAQKKVIAILESTREFWQTAADPYNPLQRHDSIQTRYEAGRALRKQVPRESHAEWNPPKLRPSGADFVIAGNVGRQQELVPLRMGRMSASPFAFLRGAAAVMAWDLSHTPITGIQTMIDGDAHINNFGLYGTPQRDIVVDLNDFDEALPGPWEWDLKRLVASVNVAARENGFNKRERRRAVMECVGGYRLNLQRLHPMGILDVWSLYGYADRKPGIFKVPKKAWILIQKTVEKARATTNETLLPKVARRHTDGGWRFVQDPPILTRVDGDTKRKVIESLKEYAETVPMGYRHMLRRYSVEDVAHRVVGVGSVGTRAYLVLLFGNGDHDPLFLQVKEAVVPAHAPYLPPLSWKSPHQGKRVVGTQRMLQSSGDPLLGYTAIDGRDFFVRQMKNMKASMPLEWLTGEPFYFWGFACGTLLARAHSRMGDAAKIAGYCGKSEVLDEALAEFAEAYGDQTEVDHASLKKAIQQGRVKVIPLPLSRFGV
jgi:uncharacterized protein (DUF2252 family)